MTEKQAGLSALSMAYARAYHATHDSPKIFDDFLANSLFTPEELAERNQTWAGLLQYVAPELAATHPDPATATSWVIQLTNGPITLPRARYAEDNLAESIQQGVRQYIILGAGFDTFAYRRPGLADRLQIFELDHPATQAIKRERVAAAGWDHPANLHFVPVDFTRESPADALKRSPYQADQLSFFSWLGVSFYLAREVVLDTLRSIASIAAPGSTIVFDYLHRDAYDPEKAGKRMEQMQYMATQLGEPLKSGFDPLTLADELAKLGLRMEENLDPSAIEARYFQGRSDRYHAVEHFHYAKAVVV
ncbi:MAG TPA: SAM-dependent methyltransferase [Anaerolineales bacterium]|nr:SAM-dependent methyltransferase [Anaerolineales bacterium]